jgi:hypothetical protein
MTASTTPGQEKKPLKIISLKEKNKSKESKKERLHTINNTILNP